MNFPKSSEQAIQHYTAESIFAPPRLARGFTERNYCKGLHTQGFYEINIVLRGSATHRIGERSLTVSSGDTFIIPPDVPHSYNGGEGFDVYHILLSPKLLEKNFSELRTLSAFSALFKIDPMLRERAVSRLHFRLNEGEIGELTPLLDSLALHDNGRDLSAESAVLSNSLAMIAIVILCGFYEKRVTDPLYAETEDDGFAKSIAYLYENYSRHVTIDELLHIAGMSRTSYITKFKRVTGVTPGRFQANYRVELAKQMLSDSSAPVSEIAAEVGCFDTSHLVRIFSEQCGVTPGEYRRRHSSEESGADSK